MKNHFSALYTPTFSISFSAAGIVQPWASHMLGESSTRSACTRPLLNRGRLSFRTLNSAPSTLIFIKRTRVSWPMLVAVNSSTREGFTSASSPSNSDQGKMALLVMCLGEKVYDQLARGASENLWHLLIKLRKVQWKISQDYNLIKRNSPQRSLLNYLPFPGIAWNPDLHWFRGSSRGLSWLVAPSTSVCSEIKSFMPGFFEMEEASCLWHKGCISTAWVWYPFDAAIRLYHPELDPMSTNCAAKEISTNQALLGIDINNAGWQWKDFWYSRFRPSHDSHIKRSLIKENLSTHNTCLIPPKKDKSSFSVGFTWSVPAWDGVNSWNITSATCIITVRSKKFFANMGGAANFGLREPSSLLSQGSGPNSGSTLCERWQFSR